MLSDAQKSELEIIGKRYGLDFIVLYGSVAKKQEIPVSDIDVAVYRGGGITPEEFSNIYRELGTIFSPRELDLKCLNGANPLFRYNVTRVGQLLYGDQTAYNFYKAFAYRDFQEAKPLFRLEEYLVKKHQKELNRLYF